MEAKTLPVTIDNWYKRAGTMDRAWRQSQEESRMYGARNSNPARRQNQGTPNSRAEAGRGQGQRRRGQPTRGWRPFNRSAQPARHSSADQPTPGSSSSRTPPDPNAMQVDQGSRPPIQCYKCGKIGHVQRNCHSTSTNIREMTFEQMADFFTNQGAVTRTEEQVARIEELKDDESQ